MDSITILEASAYKRVRGLRSFSWRYGYCTVVLIHYCREEQLYYYSIYSITFY